MILDGAIDGDMFIAYVTHVLAKELRPGDVVVMDNLPAHKVAGVRSSIEQARAKLMYLPPYSPDLNPIEMAFANLKAHLRKACARSYDEVWQSIGQICDMFTTNECRNYFKACGYEFK